VQGIGNTSDPFVITLDRTTVSQDLTAYGPIDFSAATPGAFGLIGLGADASAVSLPGHPQGHLQLLIRQDAPGNSGSIITWPSNVLWPGGMAPKLSKKQGEMDWIDLRRVGDYWVGRLVAAKIG
jgi:hypothetical protein